MLSGGVNAARALSAHVLRRAAWTVAGHDSARWLATQAGSGSDEGTGESAKGSEQSSDPTAPEYGYSIANEGAPLTVNELIGDPRTGIADDTTTAPWGDMSVEHVWYQEDSEVNWYRYSVAGPDQLPHMYIDSRLSDHTKNLIYILRAKDPNRWSIEALAEKFSIRRQRVLSILALKEMEAHAMEQGKITKGALAPYRYTIKLDDVHLDPETGEPVDLADLVALEGQLMAELQEAAAAAAGQDQQTSTSSDSSSSSLGNLEEFLQLDPEPSTTAAAAAAATPGSSSSSTAGADGVTTAFSLLQESSSSSRAAAAAADLAAVMPQVTLTAQRLQAQLLQLLQRHDYSPQELLQLLLQGVDQAETFYQQQIAGTELERRLLGGRGDDSSAAAAAGEAAAAEGDEVEQGSTEKPFWLDFEKQRQAYRQLMESLEPLWQLTVTGPSQAGAQLAAKIRRQLDGISTSSSTSSSKAPIQAAAAGGGEQKDGQQPQPEEQQQQGEEGAAAAAAAAGGGGTEGEGVEGLRGLLDGVDVSVRVAAFNKLDLTRRRQLLEVLPEMKIDLNVRGADLRALLDPTLDPMFGLGSGATAAAAWQEGVPTWPGAVPTLVDVFAFEDLPKAQLQKLQQQLPALQSAVHQLERLLQPQQQQAADAAAAAQAGKTRRKREMDLLWESERVREAAEGYVTLNLVYDAAVDEQAARAAGAEEAPPLPPAAQRRMLRILRDLDPHALEKVMFWESHAREEDPGRQRRLRMQIQALLNKMNVETAGDTPPEYPELPDTPQGHQELPARYQHDLVAAIIDAEIVGRQYNKGSGERHYVRLPTYPRFEGYTLEEFDKIGSEGEISVLNRLVAQREDDMMYGEFKERMMYNLGLAGTNLFNMRGYAKPQRPKEGWSWVVHPSGRGTAAKQEAYVVTPTGQQRSLNEEEQYLEQRKTSKARRRWFGSTRRTS